MHRFYAALYDRFHELHTEVERVLEALPPDALDWTPGKDMNSLSVLIVHLTGAERYWIGDVARGDPSNRDREAEFQVSGIDKAVLIMRLHDLDRYVKAALETLKFSDLEIDFSSRIWFIGTTNSTRPAAHALYCFC